MTIHFYTDNLRIPNEKKMGIDQTPTPVPDAAFQRNTEPSHRDPKQQILDAHRVRLQKECSSTSQSTFQISMQQIFKNLVSSSQEEISQPVEITIENVNGTPQKPSLQIGRPPQPISDLEKRCNESLTPASLTPTPSPNHSDSEDGIFEFDDCELRKRTK